MWTVLLVEDEMFVRESIKQIIDWEAEGFTVVGEASNGQEAFQFIEQHQPDLVICDIMMPVMDGIELLKKVRSEEWTNKFLMLTAHTEFEYARQAVEFGAANYILKLSMSVESLVTSLQKVRRDLEQDLKQKYIGMKDFYANAWISVLENDNKSSSEKLINHSLEKVRDDFLVIIAMFQTNPVMTTDNLQAVNLIQSSGNAVIHALSAMGQTTFFCWSSDLPKINSNISPLKDTQFVFSPVTNVNDLVNSWSEVISTLDAIWYQKQSKVLIKAEQNLDQKKLLIPWELERQMFHVFEQLKIEDCKKVTGQLWLYMKTNEFPMLQVKKVAKWMDQTFIKMANATNSSEEANESSVSHQQLEKLMCENVSGYIQSHINNESKMTDHPEINKVIVYIATNYHQNITVKRMAKYIGMDENYLSGLFKKKTEESLIHYLHRVRIQHAESYLLNSNDLSVSEIAESVGFINDNYFIKIFKRIKKETPSQYRRKNSQMNDLGRINDHELL